MWAAASSPRAATTAITAKKARAPNGSSGGSSDGSSRKPLRREVMMGQALGLFLSILGEGEGKGEGGLAPDSWCFTSVVDALVRGGR